MEATRSMALHDKDRLSGFFRFAGRLRRLLEMALAAVLRKASHGAIVKEREAAWARDYESSVGT